MLRRYSVRITYNFDKNLEEIDKFLTEQDAPEAFKGLLERLFETVIPNLERYPELGMDFLARYPQSIEGQARIDALKKQLGNDVTLREYITGEYLVLYAVRRNDVYLLSIRHHRQLSFDFKSHWA